MTGGKEKDQVGGGDSQTKDLRTVQDNISSQHVIKGPDPRVKSVPSSSQMRKRDNELTVTVRALAEFAQWNQGPRRLEKK